MQIQVLENEKVVFDNDVKKDIVILGRGSDCDIRCISEAISRHHLEIKKENGKIFVKGLSKNNWFVLNEEKVNHGDYIEYFAFYELILPGNIEVKVVLEDEEALKQVSATRYRINDNNEDIEHDNSDEDGARKVYRPKLGSAAGNKKVPYKPKAEFGEILKMSFIIVIVAGFLVFQYKDIIFGKKAQDLVGKNTDTRRTIELKKEIWEQKRNKKKKADPRIQAAVSVFETVKKVEDPLLMSKCQSNDELKICNLILSNRKPKYEGVAIKGDTLFGFLGISQRKYIEFSQYRYPGMKGIPDNYFYQTLAAFYFMDPKVFFKIRDMGINNVFVYIVDDVPMVPNEKAVFKINFQNKINYTQVDFNLAMDGILKRAIPDYFNKYLARLLVKVK